MKLSNSKQLQNLNYNIIPLDSSVCYHFDQMTPLYAIMHEDTLAKWLVAIKKIHVCFYKFKLMLVFSSNKHSWYVANRMAPEHRLPFPTSLP